MPSIDNYATQCWVIIFHTTVETSACPKKKKKNHCHFEIKRPYLVTAICKVHMHVSTSVPLFMRFFFFLKKWFIPVEGSNRLFFCGTEQTGWSSLDCLSFSTESGKYYWARINHSFLLFGIVRLLLIVPVCSNQQSIQSVVFVNRINPSLSELQSTILTTIAIKLMLQNVDQWNL